MSNKLLPYHTIDQLNPIRSEIFQTANDPGGWGKRFKSPPPPHTISKTIVSILSLPYHTCTFY